MPEDYSAPAGSKVRIGPATFRKMGDSKESGWIFASNQGIWVDNTPQSLLVGLMGIHAGKHSVLFVDYIIVKPGTIGLKKSKCWLENDGMSTESNENTWEGPYIDSPWRFGKYTSTSIWSDVEDCVLTGTADGVNGFESHDPTIDGEDLPTASDLETMFWESTLQESPTNRWLRSAEILHESHTSSLFLSERRRIVGIRLSRLEQSNPDVYKALTDPDGNWVTPSGDLMFTNRVPFSIVSVVSTTLGQDFSPAEHEDSAEVVTGEEAEIAEQILEEVPQTLAPEEEAVQSLNIGDDIIYDSGDDKYQYILAPDGETIHIIASPRTTSASRDNPIVVSPSNRYYVGIANMIGRVASSEGNTKPIYQGLAANSTRTGSSGGGSSRSSAGGSSRSSSGGSDQPADRSSAADEIGGLAIDNSSAPRSNPVSSNTSDIASQEGSPLGIAHGSEFSLHGVDWVFEIKDNIAAQRQGERITWSTGVPNWYSSHLDWDAEFTAPNSYVLVPWKIIEPVYGDYFESKGWSQPARWGGKVLIQTDGLGINVKPDMRGRSGRLIFEPDGKRFEFKVAKIADPTDAGLGSFHDAWVGGSDRWKTAGGFFRSSQVTGLDEVRTSGNVGQNSRSIPNWVDLVEAAGGDSVQAGIQSTYSMTGHDSVLGWENQGDYIDKSHTIPDGTDHTMSGINWAWTQPERSSGMGMWRNESEAYVKISSRTLGALDLNNSQGVEQDGGIWSVPPGYIEIFELDGDNWDWSVRIQPDTYTPHSTTDSPDPQDSSAIPQDSSAIIAATYEGEHTLALFPEPRIQVATPDKILDNIVHSNIPNPYELRAGAVTDHPRVAGVIEESKMMTQFSTPEIINTILSEGASIDSQVSAERIVREKIREIIAERRGRGRIGQTAQQARQRMRDRREQRRQDRRERIETGSTGRQARVADRRERSEEFSQRREQERDTRQVAATVARAERREDIFQLPDDPAWSYKVVRGQWYSRRAGAVRWRQIGPAELGRERCERAVNTLDQAFPDARSESDKEMSRAEMRRLARSEERASREEEEAEEEQQRVEAGPQSSDEITVEEDYMGDRHTSPVTFKRKSNGDWEARSVSVQIGSGENGDLESSDSPFRVSVLTLKTNGNISLSPSVDGMSEIPADSSVHINGARINSTDGLDDIWRDSQQLDETFTRMQQLAGIIKG